MIRPMIATLACLVSLASCGREDAADPDQRVRDLQSAALSDERAWALLSSLTQEVGHRLAGSPGDHAAVQWAVEAMGELGFDRVWLEPVSFPYWVRRHERGAIVGQPGEPLDLTALGGVPGTDGPVQAEVVHFPSLAALEAVPDDSLNGRIAFISQSMPRSQDGSGYSLVVPQRSRGPFVAQRKGAKALLIRSVGTDFENSAPHTGAISSTEPGTPLPSAALSNESADLLVETLGAGPVTVELDLDCGFDGVAESSNVIGEFDGSGPGGEFLLIGGHLDSWDLGTGAHDDGAGVVITMVAAALVAEQPRRPRRGIRVVLFANEEQGIYGGKQYAEAHGDELDRHVLGSESDLGADRIYEFRTRLSDEGDLARPLLERWLAPLDIPFNASSPASGGADIGQIRKIGLAVVDLRHDASQYFDLHHTRKDVLENVSRDDLAFNIAAWVTMLQWAADSDVAFGPVAPSP
ncbi:MAG: M28 family peptidase [Xanthomonadales bacterium]|nr:M28 family peptidase [Xanthomonadales bacterium]